MRNEDELLNFVAKINKAYQEKLGRPAPFMTFVICGMQSAGKSTIMERFMGAVLNIIQEGTGTRCPLDTTCIHDESAIEPKCELSGEELESGKEGDVLTIDQVFKSITEHNKRLAVEDRFSTEALRLVYRSRNVQNMRFVDTPGIISNKSTGKDNREDIKRILKNAMKKPNTKLCVLLEPKEFSTNPIVEFCDTTFGTREKWTDNAICLMTKFDKQLEDSRTGSKANNFLREFKENDIHPHLVITPTLAKEDLPPDELMKKRRELLKNANSNEEERFEQWLEGHAKFLQEDPDDELLNDKTSQRIGFPSAKASMRKVMLEDTALRLPEVLSQIRKELRGCQKEKAVLLQREKFTNPSELKSIVGNAIWHLNKRVETYLDGDLESSMKFPEKLQSLDDEVEAEDESEWAVRELNHYTASEDQWRDRIASLEGEYPDEIQADKKLLGGKQIQRAIEFFKVVMIDTLPNPYEMKDYVSSCTGYLAGGLQRENWERAMVQITKVCVKDVSHPGINYLIKHVGLIFRRLFRIALEDLKQGETFSASFKLLPTAIEKHLTGEFDRMLWDLMSSAADKTHCALEPMYSTVDPNLPTFHPEDFEANVTKQPQFILQNGAYVPVTETAEDKATSLVNTLQQKFEAISGLSGDKAKALLKKENMENATRKKNFLPDERTSMITDAETDKILCRSFQYIVALMEFNLHNLRFQINHYLYQGFKTAMSQTFSSKVVEEADWDKLVQPDPIVTKRLKEVEEKIVALEESLQEVQLIQGKM